MKNIKTIAHPSCTCCKHIRSLPYYMQNKLDARSDHRPSAPASYCHSHLGPEHSSSNQAQEDSQVFCTDAASTYARTDAFDRDHANAAANNYSHTSSNADDTATSVLARIDAKSAASFAAEEDATPVNAACQASDSACPPFRLWTACLGQTTVRRWSHPTLRRATHLPAQ